MGIRKIGISPELTIDESKELYKKYEQIFKEKPNIEVFAFGKLELMILKHCILNDNLNKNASCNICKNNKKYYLEDRNNEKYQIITKNCKNILLHYKTINYLKDFKNSNITNYYISLIGIDNKEKNIIMGQIKGW